jgi:hypothetical protein
MLAEATKRWGTELPGVSPAAVRALLQSEADKPMRAGNAGPEHQGLFGEARNQKELF